VSVCEKIVSMGITLLEVMPPVAVFVGVLHPDALDLSCDQDFFAQLVGDKQIHDYLKAGNLHCFKSLNISE